MAPTAVALHVAPTFAAQPPGVPVIPVRKARIELFALPANTSVKVVLLSFADSDTALTVTLDVVVSEPNQRFGLLLTLLDDRDRVVYMARDTVTAYLPGTRAAATRLIVVRYAGPDTAARQLVIGPRDTVLSVNDVVRYRAVATRANGTALDAVVGFSGRGVTVDIDGTVRARASVVRGGAYVFAHLATGLVDSTTVTITEPVATVSVTPDSVLALVGTSRQLSAAVRDAAGGAITGRSVAWRSSDTTIATVSAVGMVVARREGVATITATTDGREGSARVVVARVPVARLVLAPATASLRAGQAVRVSATTFDSVGGTLIGRDIRFSSSDSTVATVVADAALSATVTARRAGVATITAVSEGRSATMRIVSVTPPFSRITLSPRGGTLLVGDATQFFATVLDSMGGLALLAPVTWVSSDSTVLRVTSAGVASGVTSGTARLLASAEGVADSVTLTVRRGASLSIAPASARTSALDTRVAFGAVVLDSANAPIDGAIVRWNNSDGVVAILERNSGPTTTLLTRSAGTTTITARAGSLTATATLIVADVAPPPAIGSLSGLVFHGVSGAPLPGVTVTVRRNGLTVTTATTGTDGRYLASALPGGSYVVTFSASGFVTTEIAAITVEGTTTAEAVPLVPASESTGSISGTLRDARTNSLIAVVATVELRAGLNATTGPALQSLQVEPSASYQFAGVAAGTYTIVARAAGYAVAFRTGIAVGASTTSNQNVVLSPIGASNSVRIVLTWRAQPSDLDSHLTGPNSQGARFHVFYARSGNCAADPFACLDVDVTSGRGPETVTISKVNTGMYRYSVNNYSAAGGGSNPSDLGLSQSGARVDVYFGNVLTRSFSAPGGAGSLWTVFELNGTTITPVNVISAGPVVTSNVMLNLAAPAPTDASVIFTDVQAHPKPTPPPAP